MTVAETLAPLQRSQRMLVHLVTLHEQGRTAEGLMYRSIERGAETMARRYLRRTYRRRTLIRGPQATLESLVDALASASAEPGVGAVDLLVNPHGTSRKVWFVDGPVDADDVCAAISERLDTEQRRRLRAAFSTACYGMSHNDAWLRAGFSVCVGSRGIYADGVTSLPRLLRGWAGGQTVADAVEKSNGAGLRHRQDSVAARYYRRTGRTDDAEAVDSTRVVDGARTMVVTSDPAQWRPRHLPA